MKSFIPATPEEEAHDLSLVKALPGSALALVVLWALTTGFFCL